MREREKDTSTKPHFAKSNRSLKTEDRERWKMKRRERLWRKGDAREQREALLSTRTRTYSIARLGGIDCSLRGKSAGNDEGRVFAGGARGQRKGGRERQRDEGLCVKGEKGQKKRPRGAGKERDFSSIVHTVASPFPPSPSFVTVHTSLRNELDYWLNPDRGITYSIKKFPRASKTETKPQATEKQRQRRRLRSRRVSR